MSVERLVFCLNMAYELTNKSTFYDNQYRKAYKDGALTTLEFLMAAYEDREPNYEKSREQD